MTMTCLFLNLLTAAAHGWRRVAAGLRLLLLVGLGLAVSACSGLQLRYGARLQSTEVVLNYQPDMATRVYSAAGSLMREIVYRETPESDPEARIFVPIEAVPDHVQQAFISAEDKNFHLHAGVDWLGFGKAMVQNAGAILTGGRARGGSTITMQTVKNFVVGSERTATRKLYEMMIAQRLERQLTKPEILERYLNENYYGNKAYGIAAAALVYFDKSIRDLTIPEAAVLASLPQAPSTNNPYANPERSLARRNWVLAEMAENGFITPEEADAFQASALEVQPRSPDDFLAVPYFSAEVRRQMTQAYGADFARNGYSVRTTMDEDMQAWAQEALWDRMVSYDVTQGYRGPLEQIPLTGDWRGRFQTTEYLGLKDWQAALVVEIALPCGDALRLNHAGVQEYIDEMDWVQAAGFRTDWSCALIELQDGTWGLIPFEVLAWAREPLGGELGLGPEIVTTSDVLSLGDVVAVELLETGVHTLRQIPEVGGAFVAMDPHTGRVLALVGGWDHELFPFNGATQGQRQPGSTFKPFVYLTALDSGFSPATTVFDLPVVIPQPDDEVWRPGNDDGEFLGQVTLRGGLELSRNLATVRVADAVGMDRVVEYAKAFGIDDDVRQVLSHALGASETPLINVVSAYARVANGGKLVRASVIDRVQDRHGTTLYRHDQRDCSACSPARYRGEAFPVAPDNRPQIADPASLFQLVSMMRGVVERGTAARLGQQIQCDYVAGKTGTTNEFRDAWFVGFTPDLVAGVWIGHYEFRSLGDRQYGSVVAAPVFQQFLNRVLEERPDLCVNFRTPKGLIFSSLNPQTGLPYLEVAGRALPETFLDDQDTGCAFRDANGYCTATRTITVYEEITDPDDLIVIEEIEGEQEDLDVDEEEESKVLEISVEIGADTVF